MMTDTTLPPKGKFLLIDDAPASAPQLPPKGKFLLIDDAEPAQLSPLERAGRVLGLGGRAIVKGVSGIPTLMADAASEGINAGAKAIGADYRMQKPSAVLDRTLTNIGLPEPANAAERVSSDVTGALAGQGAVMKLGAILKDAASPVLQRIGELFASQPGGQAVAAASGSGAAGVTREAGGGPGAQLAANVAGAVAPAAAAGLVRRSPISASTQDLLNASERHDVPLSYSDVTGKGRKLDTASEQVPIIGPGKVREAGAERATTAAQRVADDAGQNLQRTPFSASARFNLLRAVRGGDKRASEILQQIETAGGDWSKVIQASGNLKLWNAQQQAGKLYDEVEALAARRPRDDVPLPNTLRAIDSAIATESASKLPDKAIVTTLSQIRDSLARGENTFSSARALRSDLGNLIDGYYQGANALVASKGVGPLQAVKTALGQDAEAYALQSGGDLANAWKRADSFYKSAVVPYKDRALAHALKSDLPDEVYSKFVKVSRSGAGEDRAAKFYDALDPKGRAAVRYGMIANALDNAAIPGKDQIAPGRFARSLEDIAKATGVFFKGDDKRELDGFVNLMRHAERFGQYAENPPTGNRLVGLLLGGGALAGSATHPAATGAAILSTAAARWLTTNRAGRDFLIRASQAKVGAPEMDRLLREMERQLPRITAEEANRSD